MEDPTDVALASCAILGILLCGIGGCWSACRNGHRHHQAEDRPGLKASPSMEHLADAASDDTTDPANNNIV